MTKLCIWMLAALLPLIAAQDNPAAGTWKLDVAKSKFSPGPPPKSATLTIEAQGDSVKTKLDEVEADDSHTGYEYTASLDGKDYPLAGSAGPERLRGADAVILRRNGTHAYGAMFKKSGQVMMTNMTTVSKDGKTLTLVVNGADAKGEPVKLMLVWEKQ
jgi:hypothetical protein